MLEQNPISRRRLLKLALLSGASAIAGGVAGTLATLELTKEKPKPPREELVDLFDQMFKELKTRSSNVPDEFYTAAKDLDQKGYALELSIAGDTYGFSPDPENYPIYVLQSAQGDQSQIKILSILDLHPLESHFSTYAITENQVAVSRTSWTKFPEQSRFYNHPLRVVGTKSVSSLNFQLQADFANWLAKQ